MTRPRYIPISDVQKARRAAEHERNAELTPKAREYFPVEFAERQAFENGIIPDVRGTEDDRGMLDMSVGGWATRCYMEKLDLLPVMFFASRADAMSVFDGSARVSILHDRPRDAEREGEDGADDGADDGARHLDG